MAKNSILGLLSSTLFTLFTVCSITVSRFPLCSSYGQDGGGGQYDSYTISSFTYAKTVLKPYDWRYIRVDLPPWFSSMSMAFDTDVDLDLKEIRNGPTSTLPMICFREGSPPLPDVYNITLSGLVLDYISNSSVLVIQDLQTVEKCFPMQKSIFVRLTNEQISPGIWYIGLFNGIGPMRTQSKMINRGPSHSFSGNISVEGCTTSMMFGEFCNQTFDSLSCVVLDSLPENGSANKSYNQTEGDIISCRNNYENNCHGSDETKVYSLDLSTIAEKLIITASSVSLTQTQPSNSTSNSTELMCYVRHGAIPLAAMHDYSGNIDQAPLVIQSPKLGRWFISIQPANLSEINRGMKNMSSRVCYMLEWRVLQCPVDKAGPNCTWERYMLQTFLRKNPSVPFESYYLPISGKVSSQSANFQLEPLLSNSSYGKIDDAAWTFFVLDIPSGAAGGNIHIRLTSDEKINYEVYAKHGSLPSVNSWDYFYANKTSSSNGSMFFKSYDSSEKSVSFYILYVRGGTWSFGLRHWNPSVSGSVSESTMSISLERCPHKCSSHGSCQSVVDVSGLTLYSYCWCDRNHGGFDCSIELVSHRGHILETHVGHMWQSISLIASNAAALLPAYWALRQKAFAEWVLYTSSGISSGLYHACDVGTWCALSFHVLQFLDFWLSFMAVVSTFVYLAAISEVSKRTIHTVVAIVTALMAENGPTRSSNIVLVLAIGASGLLVGLLIEFWTRYSFRSFTVEFSLNLLHRWQNVKGWIGNLFKTLVKRFRWGFILAGFTALGMAAISWVLENSKNYWIWHSMWHVSIYTSSFLFLCSKSKTESCEDARTQDGAYALTRQDSFAGAERNNR